MIETSAAGIFQTLKKEKNWLSLRPEKIAQILLEICNLPHKYNNLRTKKGELIEPEIKSETNSDIHPESQLESHTEVNFVQGNECQQNITSTSKNSVFKLRDPWVLSAVVLCLPISIFQSRQELEHWCRAFMEVLEVAAIAFVPQPLMACYGCGVVNGLVLDIGYETLRKFLFDALFGESYC